MRDLVASRLRENRVNQPFLKKSKRVLAVFGLFLFVWAELSCDSKRLHYPALETHVSGPIDMVSYKGFFIVLNSDQKHQYDTGSLLILDKDDKTKKTAYITPRLGKTLSLKGDQLFVTFHPESQNDHDDEHGLARLYQLSQAEAGVMPKISFLKEFSLQNCQPLGMALSEADGKFAVSCQNRQILLGEVAADPTASKDPKKIRRLPFHSQALFFDQVNTKLLVFPTDLSRPTITDFLDESSAENDFPDKYTSSEQLRSYYERNGSQFQFARIGLTNDLSEMEYKEELAKMKDEIFWLNFNLKVSADENEEDDQEGTKKYYRSNFAQALPGKSANSFYLVHRGLQGRDLENKSYQLANQVIKVDIKKVEVSENIAGLFDFSRVKSFSGADRYLNKGTLLEHNSKDWFVATSFMDPATFEKEKYHLLSLEIPDVLPASEEATAPSIESSGGSYFCAAALSDASGLYVMTGSFFDDTMVRYKLSPEGFSKLD